MLRNEVRQALAAAMECWGYDGRYYKVDYEYKKVRCYEYCVDDRSPSFGDLVQVGEITIGKHKHRFDEDGFCKCGVEVSI